MNSGNLSKSSIVIHVEYSGELYELRTYNNEYRSLMMLIYDRIFTDGFGECLGMGKCGTCLIEITNKLQEPAAYERNGDANLQRAGQTGENIRLSCQLLIDEKIDGLAVKVLT
ncbi:2Fe-2S iron-sulfur cluster binding domain-containing protein [Mucilaginibacter sp. HC2]|uniref:2Fe-2S iron-sulfur cluster-binding protein n=1 Tax=Mucilaginibacter inviolabilis TaxID=2714892 RepID=UPI00140C6C97|nr:2Fe-2S iron-sulfur cluster-binding protein [Mucilaginibacter inviolabilis]NHA02651.1 2Fe-2S iron-sulfur cluster binding domain-containing protein [Mucilaginibacter inviolabilis]